MATSTYPVTLMTNLRQPTDAFVGSAPLLWQYNARDFQHLALVMMWTHTPPPGYESIRRPSFAVTATTVRRVAVAELSTTNTETIPCTPEEREAPAVVTDSHPVPVVSTPPAAVIESQPEDSVVPVPEPNPYSFHVPDTVGVHDSGHGDDVRFIVKGSGNALGCELCKWVGTRKEWSEHWDSEGHGYEEERQRFWMFKCVVCNINCDGFKCFEDHVAGKKHRRRVEASGLLKPEMHEWFCGGFLCSHPECMQC